MAINVDAEDLREKAESLRSEADDLREIITNGKSLLEALVDAGFEGAASQAFIDKYDEVTPDLEKAADLLESVGDALDDTAQNFEDMDDEIASSIMG